MRLSFCINLLVVVCETEIGVGMPDGRLYAGIFVWGERGFSVERMV